jgi:cytosine/adenosine deaminase-related metal-dependent hydrolase
MPLRRQPVSLTHARVVTGAGEARSIRIGSRVLSLDEPPGPRDAIVDLDGAFVLPGLINAHDHLELNNFGPVRFRDRYQNASEWIDDVDPRLDTDAALVRNRSVPIEDRLLIGALKNLLAGATTVAHHNPLHRAIDRTFPIRVVRRYGWAHSLYLDDNDAPPGRASRSEVVRRYRRTPGDAPFLIHLAEGLDEAAGAELGRLDRLGCLGANTVAIHGVGLSDADWALMSERGAGLIWCPASNLFLLGRTAPVRRFLDSSAASADRIALGTDSRLTGARDLLDELRAAKDTGQATPGELVEMVTRTAARLLRLGGAGRLSKGNAADLLVIPRLAEDPAEALLMCRRRDLLAVLVEGRPAIGSTALSDLFGACGLRTARATLDGREMLMATSLADRVRRATIVEPGLDLAQARHNPG